MKNGLFEEDVYKNIPSGLVKFGVFYLILMVPASFFINRNEECIE